MKRDRSEWMPFLGDAFYDSEHVIALEPAAEALYLRMLFRQWQHGGLPSDPKALRALFPAKFSERFDELLSEILPCFELRSGRLVSVWIEEIRASRDWESSQTARYRRLLVARSIARHTEEEWVLLVESVGRCVACFRSDVPLTRDHIIPISRGGHDGIDNIQPLCRRCNSSKGNRVASPDGGVA